MALYLGLMSGTSMDGIDAALVEIDNTKISLIESHSAPLQPALKRRLEGFYSNPLISIQTLGETDIELGQAFAQAALELLRNSQHNPASVSAIGSHGQTIFHAPNGSPPFTLQIGDPNTIAELTGITTVADFRRRDMAAGGQGAPLVPAFHNKLFRSTKKNRVIINIGGVANITILPKKTDTPCYGFDTGPGNALMDGWTQQHINQPFDRDGQWARSGRRSQPLLTRLESDPYFRREPPKSTGKEYFNLTWLEDRLRGEAPADIQRTLVSLTTKTITDAIENYADDTEEVYVCGGGAHNELLMEELAARLPCQSTSTTETLGIHPDWVEAVAFAWLAKQCLDNQPANLPTATGAHHPTILGGVYPGAITI